MGTGNEKMYNPHLGNLEDFMKNNQALVYAVARRYFSKAQSFGMDTEDIISHGNLGLLEAYRRYDPSFKNSKGEPVKISTIAVPWIAGKIQLAFRESGFSVKYSRNVIDLVKRIRIEELEDMSAEEISLRLGESESLVTHALLLLKNGPPLSLDRSVRLPDENEKTMLKNTVPDEEDFSVLYVNDFLEHLSEQDRKIIQLRMKGFTQVEISERVGLTQAGVSRRLKKIGRLYEEFSRRGIPKNTKNTKRKEVSKNMIEPNAEDKKEDKGVETKPGEAVQEDIKTEAIERVEWTCQKCGSNEKPTNRKNPLICVDCFREARRKPKRRQEQHQNGLFIRLAGNYKDRSKMYSEIERAISHAEYYGEFEVTLEMTIHSIRNQGS